MFQCLRLNFYFVLRLIVCEDPHLVVYILTLWTRGSVHTFLLPNKHKTRFFRLSPWQLKEKCGRKVHVNNLHYSHETDLTLAPEFLPGFLILFENLFWILSNLIIACVETLTFCINDAESAGSSRLREITERKSGSYHAKRSKRGWALTLMNSYTTEKKMKRGKA